MDPHKIPSVYVEYSGIKPAVHIFPHFEDFLYVFENIGGERTIQGVPPKEHTSMNRGGKRKTRTRKTKTKTRRQRS